MNKYIGGNLIGLVFGIGPEIGKKKQFLSVRSIFVDRSDILELVERLLKVKYQSATEAIGLKVGETIESQLEKNINIDLYSIKENKNETRI